MKVLVLGASGSTGSDLVNQLLADENVASVHIIVRKPIAVSHAKLTAHSIDFDQPDTWENLLQGDVLYSCLGTTLKAAGSKAAQWKVDYDYQFAFASAASQNKVPTYVLVSSANADAKSVFFYSKMKGKLEAAVKALNFNKLIIFQPPLLLRKDTDRSMEFVAGKVLSFLNKIGLFKAAKPLQTVDLAHAMRTAVNQLPNGIHTLEGQEIRQFT